MFIFVYDVVVLIIGMFYMKYLDIQVEMCIIFEIELINCVEIDIFLCVVMYVIDNVVVWKFYVMVNGIFVSKYYVENIFLKVDLFGDGLDWIGFSGVEDFIEWLVKI